MIKISKSGNSILVEGLDNKFYPDNGKLTFPSNSLILTIDESDMATFRSAANNDVMFSGLIENITISDETVTKDDIISKFGVVAYSTSGGGGGTGAVSSVNGQTGDVVITASSLGAITKATADATYQAKGDYATQAELDEKQEVFQVNAPMSFSRDEATQDLHLSIDLNNYATKSEIPDVSDMETKTDAAATYQPKGNYATKTELGNVSAEVEHKADRSDVYTMQEVDTKLNGKQNTLTAGTNITISEDNVISATGGGGESGVASVNGQTGEVVLDIPTAQVGQDGTSSNYVYSDTNNRVIRKLNVLELSSSIQLQGIYWGGNGYDGSTLLKGATTSKAGVMTAADKTKLDSIDTAEIEQVIGDVAVLQTDIEGKQDTLVSGTNIKTINGESVLGSGDIVISGGGSTDWNDITNKPTIPSAQGGSSGTNVQYIYSSKDSLNYRSVASQRLVQKGGYTSMEYWYWGQSEKEATIMDFPYATSSNGGSMSPSDKTKLDSIPSMSVLTQSEYDALPSKDANTLYFIKE